MIKKTHIVIDTREKKPYTFNESLIVSTRATLKTGDYSVLNMEDKVCVERKSKEDLIHTLTRGRDRVSREFKRMQSMIYACVIVECPLSDIIEKKYDSGMTPQALLSSILSIDIDYGVPVFFTDNRIIARIMTQEILRFCDGRYGDK